MVLVQCTIIVLVQERYSTAAKCTTYCSTTVLVLVASYSSSTVVAIYSIAYCTLASY
jgi:hypothetical protein